MLTLILIVFAAAIFAALFTKSAMPRGFDQMPESLTNEPETEYQDQVKIIPHRTTEPKIRETINV